MVRGVRPLAARSGPLATRSAARSISATAAAPFRAGRSPRQTQAAIDAEVSRLLRDAENRAVDVLNDHRDVLERLVELLLLQETVDGAQVYALAGRPSPELAGGMTVAPDRANSVEAGAR